MCQGYPWLEVQRGHWIKLRFWSLDCHGDPKMLDVPKSWNACQEGKLLQGSGSGQEKQFCCNQENIKELGIWIERWHQTWRQSLEFTHLEFGLALVKYFFNILSFLHFGKVLYILYHYMLEACGHLFSFYKGLQLRECIILLFNNSIFGNIDLVTLIMGIFFNLDRL